MAWAGLDQRAFPRVSAKCNIWIRNRIGGGIKTQTQNLGTGGACVILKQALEKLSRVHLSLSLEEPSPAIECDGRVVWMIRSKSLTSKEVSFDIGIEFLDLKTDDRDHILAFIQRQS